MNLRILTTVIGLPIVLFILLCTNCYVVDACIAIVLLRAVYEYKNCLAKKKIKVISWIMYLAAISVGFIHIIPEQIVNTIILYSMPTIALILFGHVVVSDMKITLKDVVYTLLGIVYLIGFTLFIPIIAGKPYGKYLIFLVFFPAWGTDSFAYLIGRKFGKHKFSSVSPNKSIEGCIAGTVSSVILCLLLAFIMNSTTSVDVSYVAFGIAGVILSLIGQLGDFSASAIKRSFGIKDYSDLIPGHGGIIDRIDSLMFIAPFANLFITLFM